MLFETHRMMLDDLDYTDRISELITSEKYSAEAAVRTAGKEFSEMFATMDDDYMKARSVDVTDISNRVISVLSGRGDEFTLDKPSIILADDLTQYTIAVDRQSIQGLERFYDPKHPAVLRMIKMTVDAAHEAGIWAGICGELAADCSLTETFIKMGVDELSVSPRSVLPIRNAVRSSFAK